MSNMFNSNIDVVGFTQTVASVNEVKNSLESDSTWIVGTNVEYAVYVEYGTEDMSAQPYLRPAVREAVREIESEDFDNINSLIETLAYSIEEKAKTKAPVDTGNLRRSIEAEQI